MTETKPKKPAGWYSEAAKAERAAEGVSRKAAATKIRAARTRTREARQKTIREAASAATSVSARVILADAVRKAEQVRAEEQQPLTPDKARNRNLRPERKDVEQVHDRTIAEDMQGTTLGHIVVPDPYPNRYSRRRQLLKVSRSLRDDPLARMHDRGQIGDLEYMAGRRWQQLIEKASIGAGSGDMTRENVDGGKIADPNHLALVTAVREVVRIDTALGKHGAELLRDVLLHRISFEGCARKKGWCDALGRVPRRNVDFISRRVREVLETLAVEFGLGKKAHISRPSSSDGKAA